MEGMPTTTLVSLALNDEPCDTKASTRECKSDVEEQEESASPPASVAQLAALYTRGKRIQELASVWSFLLLLVYTGSHMVWYYRLSAVVRSNTTTEEEERRISGLGIALAGVAGVVTADFCSGFVHWAADTWGSVDTPLVGKTLIWSFREHHLDPTAITRHDFVTTNGDSFAICLPHLLVLATRVTVQSRQSIVASYYYYCYIHLLIICVALTNQIHKWSHTYVALPWYARLLQASRLILPRRHHRIHHCSPHDTYYCITTGWLNRPLELLAFWPALERCVVRLTGATPRQDDLHWAAAAASASACAKQIVEQIVAEKKQSAPPPLVVQSGSAIIGKF